MLVCFVGGKSTDLVQTWLKTEARGLKPLGSQRAARESVRGPLPGAGLCVPTFQQPARCERLNPLGSSAPRPVGTCLSPFLPPSIPSSRLCCIPGLLRSVPSGPRGDRGLASLGGCRERFQPFSGRSLPVAAGQGQGLGPWSVTGAQESPAPEEAPAFLLPLEEEQADCCNRCLI